MRCLSGMTLTDKLQNISKRERCDMQDVASSKFEHIEGMDEINLAKQTCDCEVCWSGQVGKGVVVN